MKKLEVVFSVLLVVALVAPGLSLGQTWVGPVAPFSNLSPAPELPISEGSSKQGKSANISIPQINISGDTEYLQKTQNTLPETNSIMLGFNKGLSWGSNLLSVGSTGFFNFIAEGIKLPSKSGNPSSPVAGTIYYDSNAKEVKLYDGATWKSIGSGAAGGGSSQWSDISGNIAYGFSKTIPSPRHNGLVIKNDKATRDQFCIEDASVADSVKYTLGEGD